MAERDLIFPAGRQALYAKHRYSAAVRSGDLLHVSGQVCAREDGSPEPDFALRTDRAFDNLIAVLEAANCGLADIEDLTTFHTDPEARFAVVLAAKARFFPEPPYRGGTAVGVTRLSGFDFETKVFARIP